MSLTTENFVQFPDDGGNTGKQLRTHQRNVGTNTVHNHFQEIQDPQDDLQARVLNHAPQPSDGGLVVRPVGEGTTNELLLQILVKLEEIAKLLDKGK